MESTKTIELIRALVNNQNLDSYLTNEIECLYRILDYQDCLYLLNLLSKKHFYEKNINKKIVYNMKLTEIFAKCVSELITVFNDSKIPYALVKGMALSQIAYKNPYMRKSTDIDILIDKQNLSKIENIIIQYGGIQGVYRDGNIYPVRTIKKMFFEQFTHQTIPYHISTHNSEWDYVAIDINFSFLPAELISNLSRENFLQAITKIELSNFTVPVLPIEHHIVQYAMNVYKDTNSVYLLYAKKNRILAKYCDLLFLVKNNYTKIDFGLFEKIINENKIRPYIYSVFVNVFSVFADPCLIKILLLSESHEGRTIQNSYGIKESERHEWKISLEDRISAENFKSILENQLTDSDRTKIKVNLFFNSN